MKYLGFLSAVFSFTALLAAQAVEGEQRNLYEVLGVSDDADNEEIEQAFRIRRIKTHPDKNLDRDTTAEFLEVKDAYDILSDPLKKKDYDLNRRRHRPAPSTPARNGDTASTSSRNGDTASTSARNGDNTASTSSRNGDTASTSARNGDTASTSSHNRVDKVRIRNNRGTVLKRTFRGQRDRDTVPSTSVHNGDTAPAHNRVDIIRRGSSPAAQNKNTVSSPPPPARHKGAPQPENPAPHTLSLGLKKAARRAKERLDRIHSQYKYSQGHRDSHYWTQRAAIDRDLRGESEILLKQEGRRQLFSIPEEVLHFPQTVSLLAESQVDLTEEALFSILRAAIKRREPDSFRALIRRNQGFINKKTKKGTPVFILVLKKIRHTLNEAARHYNRPSCPPSCYGSWKQSAERWNDLAKEILDSGVVDLTLRSAEGDFPLLTALKLDLDISKKILYEGDSGPLTNEDRRKLREIARKKGDTSLERRFSFNSADTGGGDKGGDLSDEALNSLTHFSNQAAQELGAAGQRRFPPQPKDEPKGSGWDEGAACPSEIFRRLVGKG